MMGKSGNGGGYAMKGAVESEEKGKSRNSSKSRKR